MTDTAEIPPLPPTPECEPHVYCPFTNNGAYHGVCLWHESTERTCTCNGATDHASPSAATTLDAVLARCLDCAGEIRRRDPKIELSEGWVHACCHLGRLDGCRACAPVEAVNAE